MEKIAVWEGYMNALQLRMLACICMLADHIGYIWGIDVLRMVGRLAFPLFVFLICNGFLHTSNRSRYAMRLGLFALISQIPYCLFCGYENYLQRGNVFVSLLLAMLCLWAMDAMRKHGKLRFFCWLPPLVLFACYHIGWLNSDYGIRGVLLILVFFFVERRTLQGKLLTILGMFLVFNYPFLMKLGLSLLKGLGSGGWNLPSMSRWNLVQNCSLAAGLLMFAYNGEKGKLGRHPKLVQYGFYWFYPVHQLVLWAIGRFF